MSQRVSTGTVTAIIVVVVIVLGIIAWKVLGGHSGPNQAEVQSQQQLEMQSHARQMGGGTGGVPGGPGGPGGPPGSGGPTPVAPGGAPGPRPGGP